MALPTAPCTRCRATVVYGERGCRACGEPFSYGPSPPPEPSSQQIAEALLAADMGFEHVYTSPASESAQARYESHAEQVARAAPVPVYPVPAYPPAPVPGPVPAPYPDAWQAVDAAAAGPALSTVPADPLIDTGRADPVGNVATEEVPGFIDSRLFGAMVPSHVPTEVMPDLEPTFSTATVDAAPDDSLRGWLDTGRFEDNASVPVTSEEIPGFIDSRLFGAFTPAEVQVETMPDIELQSNAASRGGPASPAARGKGPVQRVFCADCGAGRLSDVDICQECGSRRRR